MLEAHLSGRCVAGRLKPELHALNFVLLVLRERDGAKRCVELPFSSFAVGDHLCLCLCLLYGFEQRQHVAIRLAGIRLVQSEQLRVIQHANRAASATALRRVPVKGRLNLLTPGCDAGRTGERENLFLLHVYCCHYGKYKARNRTVRHYKKNLPERQRAGALGFQFARHTN